MSTTTTGNLTEFLPQWWDARLAENLFPHLLLFNFGERRRVPRASGNSIKIPRPQRKNVVGAAPAQGTALLASALSAQTVSGTMTKFAGAYEFSDLILMTGLSDSVEMAVRLLAKDLGREMDDHIRDQLSGSQAVEVDSGGETTVGSASANVFTGDIITQKTIARAVAELDAENNSRWPGSIYPAIIHPLQQYDLFTNLSANAWVQINQGSTDRALSMLYEGALGDLYGGRIWTSTNSVSKLNTGFSTVASGYRSFMIAPQAYFVTDVDSDLGTAETIVKPLGSAGSADPDNSLATVAAKVFFTAIPAAYGSENRLVRMYSSNV